MATYNGHKNWNHWNVSLWINNDEGLYQLAQRSIRNRDRRDAAMHMLTELAFERRTRTPDGAPYTVSSVMAAMRGM